jgi:hypothetical protein
MWMFPQGNQPSVDRSALMKRAHLIARRFIGILPNNRVSPTALLLGRPGGQAAAPRALQGLRPGGAHPRKTAGQRVRHAPPRLQLRAVPSEAAMRIIFAFAEGVVELQSRPPLHGLLPISLLLGSYSWHR